MIDQLVSSASDTELRSSKYSFLSSKFEECFSPFGNGRLISFLMMIYVSEELIRDESKNKSIKREVRER